MTTSIQSLGGKARAASMTPEERTKAARHAATKGARKLGKEGRRLRALKGAATRKARAEAARKWVKVERCSVCLDVAKVISVDELMRLQTTPECVVSVEGNKVTAGMCGGMTNALSSLRSAGHVVSEPKPGSRREKLWRLA